MFLGIIWYNLRRLRKNLQKIFDAIFGEHIAHSIFENVTRLTMTKGDQKESPYLYHIVDDEEYLYTFDPKFASDNLLYRSELEYQKMTGQFPMIERSDTEMVVFDHFLYQHNHKVTIVDTKTMRTKQVTYIPADRQKLGSFFVSGIKDSLRNNDIHI